MPDNTANTTTVTNNRFQKILKIKSSETHRKPSRIQ